MTTAAMETLARPVNAQHHSPSSPLKMTKQRTAVADVLGEHNEFRSAQHLHDDLLTRGETVGLATVYRTLQALADARVVDVLRTDDGEALYRMCATREHHHHLVCRNCGATVEIDGPTVEQWASIVAGDHGFSDIAHTIELWGICANCRAAGFGGSA
jgi:Fur family ferric uptake transcriptional regulator